jgi:hypothetical protein
MRDDRLDGRFTRFEGNSVSELVDKDIVDMRIGAE